jgi:DNA primase
MNGTTLTRSSFDRGRLPVPDVFFRENVRQYRRSGHKARATCPFCQATRQKRSYNPPFAMDLQKGLWHCHCCQRGGDIVDFVRERDGVGFVAAVKQLGAWRSMDPREVEAYDRERRARLAKEEAKHDRYISAVYELAAEMELYERLHRDAAAKFILLKAENHEQRKD